jgi:predicted CxxxxCH...CXXCH cytochrome family protein
MSQITKITTSVLLLLVGLLAGGCGDPNTKAPFNSDKAAHPAGWLPSGHAVAAKADGSSCAECHGSDLSGGISSVSCLTCHENGSPFTSTGCTSCHGNPPSGTEAPNRGGAHATHNALLTVKDVCDTCHSGAGSGTLNHDDGAIDLNLLAAYSSKSGTAVYNPDGTCSNVSCHGGQKTPAWLSGAIIDVSTQCASCHSFGTTQYNSYASGQHYLHVTTYGFSCLVCHDAQQLNANHFTTLNTPTMEGPASATIINDGSWNTYANSSCTPQCHETRSWQ